MIIVTGGAGFVGSNIVRAFNDLGFEVMAIDDMTFGSEKNIVNGVLYKLEKFKYLSRDFCTDQDVLIHCATANIIFAMKNPLETIKTNALETIELFGRFPGKIINFSTSSVYGDPEIIPTPETAKIRLGNPYDTSKRIVELYLQKRGNFTTLRPTNIYGYNQRPENPYCGVIGRMIDCHLRDEKFVINGHGYQTRDFTFVDDVVMATLKALEIPSLDTEINIGTGSETSIRTLVQLLSRLTGRDVDVKYGEPREIDYISRRCLDVRKAQASLTWTPRFGILDGLKKTLEWWEDELKTY